MTQLTSEDALIVMQAFIRNMNDWDEPVVLAWRSDGDINAIVYKIGYTHHPSKNKIYEIAFFTKDNFGKYQYSHKYNLAELHKQYCSTLYNSLSGIRQFGDDVLHRQTIRVNNFIANKEALHHQASILQKMLIATGGVGIAANQCSEIDKPLMLTLVGVDYHNPEHVVRAITRYPNTLFPQLSICVNPMIVDVSSEMNEFAEGCLSVQGQLRAVVKRPKSITVKYQDLDGVEHKHEYSGSDARVMQHELDHILNGRVYMELIIDELSRDQCQLLADLISQIDMTQTKKTTHFMPLAGFDRDSQGCIKLNVDSIKECCEGMNREALRGLLDKLNSKLRVNHVQKK